METSPTVIPDNLNDTSNVPSGIDLLREKVSTGYSYKQLGDKYGCSKENIYTKIQRVISTADPDNIGAYIKNNVNILKTVEAINIIESVNPEKLKKTSSTQHMVNAKICSEMVQLKEHGPPQPVNINLLINEYKAMISREPSVIDVDSVSGNCKEEL